MQINSNNPEQTATWQGWVQFQECAEAFLSTIVKVIVNAKNFFRTLVMIPAMGVECLRYGSKIEFIARDQIDFQNDTAILEKYENFAQASKTKILFCPSGPSSIEWKEKLIKNAQYSLEVSGNYCGGKPFDRFLALFKEKLETNDTIIIRLLASPMLLTDEQRQVIKTLEETYPNRFETVICPNVWQMFPKVRMIEQHTKMVIADQKYFVAGGNAVTNSQLPENEIDHENTLLGHMLDIDVAGEGETAKKLKLHFDDLWVKWKNKAEKTPNATIDSGFNLTEIPLQDLGTVPEFISEPQLLEGDCSLYVGGSEQGKQNLCENEYLKMIRQADKKIVISHMLFNRKKIIKALENALRCGRDVEVLTNGDNPDMKLAIRSQGCRNLHHFEKLFKVSANHVKGAGEFKISVQDKNNKFLHTKMMVIDEKILAIGSFNIDNKSARIDDEILLTFKSEQIAKESLLHLENIKHDLKPLTEDILDDSAFKHSMRVGTLFEFAMKDIF